MTDAIRLFGVPGAEEVYLSIAEAFENQIEPWRDEHDPDDWPASIEEWTVGENRRFFPSVEDLLEDITEGRLIDQVNEYWWEDAANKALDEEVKASFESALSLWASKVTYRMADRHVSTYEITLDIDHRPLVDGQPLYVRACPYWPTGRHVFRGHTDGSTDPCRCGAKWNGPKPAIPPPDPRRPVKGGWSSP